MRRCARLWRLITDWWSIFSLSVREVDEVVLVGVVLIYEEQWDVMFDIWNGFDVHV